MCFKNNFFELASKYSKLESQTFGSNISRNAKTLNGLVKELNLLREELDSICSVALNKKILFELEEFLTDEDQGVRVLTAMYFLFENESKAKQVLLELTEEGFPIGINARTILGAWETGRMKL